MDDLLSKLLSFPPHPPPPQPISDQHYDEAIRAQIELVKKIPESKLLQPTSGENPLDVINPALNTVPYSYILLANISALQKGSKGVEYDKLWAAMLNFLESFDPRQIRYLGQELLSLIDSFASIARRNREPSIVIEPIRNALMKLDPSGTMLTSTHLLLVRLALESNQFNSVVPVLEKPILYVPGSTSITKAKYPCDMTLSPSSYITIATNLTSKLKHADILEYFYYSGLVFIALKDWENAQQCLENAVTYPAKDSAVSKIMVEAYKKWVLVGLMLEGRALSLPKSTSSGASKAYHILAKPYDVLAQLFESATASRLKAEVDVGTRIWQNDCNTGLVLHVLTAYQKFQIKGLGKVYTKISVPEVLNQTQSAEFGGRLPNAQAVDTLVRSMLADGALHATLSNPPNSTAVLTFATMGSEISESQVQRDLLASTQRIQALTKDIQQTDKILTHDKEFIRHIQKLKKNAKLSSVDQGIGGADMDWNPEDEDIMSMY